MLLTLAAPGTQATPGTPATPATPGTPATPSTPAAPGTPAHTTQPSTPTTQATPGPLALEPAWSAQAPYQYPIRWLELTPQALALVGSDYSRVLTAYTLQSGDCVWTTTTHAANWTAPLVSATSFHLFSFDQALVSFDTLLGEFRWSVANNRARTATSPYSYTARYSTLSPPSRVSPVAYNDMLLTLSSSGRLTFIENTGNVKSRAFLSLDRTRSFIPAATPTVVGDALYFATTNGFLWNVNLKNPASFGNHALRPFQNQRTPSFTSEVRVPAVFTPASSTLMLATMDGTVHGYRISLPNTKFLSLAAPDYTPQLIWQTRLAPNGQYQCNSYDEPINFIASAPSSEDTTVYVATRRALTALDSSTGKILWHKRLPMGVSTRVVAFERYLILASEGHELLAFNAKRGTVAARLPLSNIPCAISDAEHNRIVLGYPNGTLEAISLRRALP